LDLQLVKTGSRLASFGLSGNLPKDALFFAS